MGLTELIGWIVLAIVLFAILLAWGIWLDKKYFSHGLPGHRGGLKQIKIWSPNGFVWFPDNKDTPIPKDFIEKTAHHQDRPDDEYAS